MALDIAGVGIVSPLGEDAQQHVFHLRAKLRPAVASPMRSRDDAPIDLLHVALIGAHLALPERLAVMAVMAAEEALAEARAAGADADVGVVLAGPMARSGLDGSALEPAALALRSVGGHLVRTRFLGDGGGLAALAAADRWCAEGTEQAVLVVAVDSFVDPAILGGRLEHPPGPWSRVQPPPGEGAAAVVVTPRGGCPRPLATLEGVADQRGVGTDDDDEAPDGAALVELLRALPGGPIDVVWGQQDVDDLREREWQLAAARAASRFAPTLAADSLERFSGRLGAAAGLSSLVVGLASMRHHAVVPGVKNLLAWAISPDGQRVAALARGAA